MRWIVFAACVLFSSTACAEENAGAFHREVVVKLLGYDPERSIADQCESLSNTANIVRVALLKKGEPEKDVVTYLMVAGMIGAARGVCAQDAGPAPLSPFVEGGVALENSVCVAAGDALVGRVKEEIDKRVLDDHPDTAAGFVQGVADVLPPLVEACYAHEQPWSRLSAQSMLLGNRAKSLNEMRACTLWRAAFNVELRKAGDMGEQEGRAAGLAYLEGQVMYALVGSRNYCTDELGKAFEASNYDLTRTMINSLPEK